MKIRINFTDTSWCVGEISDSDPDVIWKLLTDPGAATLAFRLDDGRILFADRDKIQNIVLEEGATA